MSNLFSVLRPRIGLRADPLTYDESDTPLPDSLTVPAGGLSLDQCHDLLTLPRLRTAFRQDLDTLPVVLSRTIDDAVYALLTTLDGRLSEAGLAPRLLRAESLLTSLPPLSSYLPSLVGLVADSAGVVGRAGLRIRPLVADTGIRLERVQLAFETAPSSLELVLNDENSGADFVTTINPLTGIRWYDLPLDWPVLTAGHAYRLTYDQTELGTARLLNTYAGGGNSRNMARGGGSGCAGCGSGNCPSRFVELLAFAGDKTGTATLLPGNNVGINLIASVRGDVSVRLSEDPARLMPALKQQVALTFLQKLAFSDRHNGPAEETIQGALFALYDKDNPARIGTLLDSELTKLVKALARETADSLSVNNSGSILMESI